MDRQAFIDKLFARAQSEGFEAYEAYYVKGNSFEVSVFGGEIVDYTVSESLGLGFRALTGGKMGYASTQALDDDAVEFLIASVKDSAALIENDDPQFIFGGGEAYAQVDNYSQALDAVTPAQKIAFARELEKAALAQDPRIQRVDGCSVMTESSERAIRNSKGLNLASRQNVAVAYVAPIAEENGRVNTGMKFQMEQEFSALDAQAIAKAAVERALTGLTAQQPASAMCAIAFENRAAASLLGVFSSIFSAEAAQKGLSLLKGREGEAIASEAVTIVDDPHRPHSAASQSFDGEGVPTRKKNVVEKGVLQTLLHNLTTAAKQGVTTTGNAARGYASAVGVAPTNFYIAPSQESVEAMLARMGEGFLITEVSGLHAGANQISGDFSLLAKGFAVRGGQKAEPVEQITVAGNFFAVLKDVVAVADDLAFGLPGGSLVGSPTIWVKALSVAGK